MAAPTPDSRRPSVAPMGATPAARQRASRASFRPSELPPGFVMSEKGFAHLFLDGRIRNSGLEGMTFPESVLQTAALLQSLNSTDLDTSQLSEDILQAAVELLAQIPREEEEDRFDNWGAPKRVDPAPLAARYRAKIEAMRVGEELFVPMAWITDKGGHMMLGLLKKTERGFDFTHINTGAGLHYHDSKRDGKKKRNSPYLYFKDIPATALFRAGSNTWLESLFDVQLNAQPKDFDADVYYNSILAPLWTYKAALPEDMAHFITPQRDGTCAWKSMMAYLRLKLGAKAYKTLHCQMRWNVLAAAESGNPALAAIPPKLIRPAIEVFAKEVHKKWKSGLLTIDEAQRASELIANLKKKFQEPHLERGQREQIQPSYWQQDSVQIEKEECEAPRLFTIPVTSEIAARPPAEATPALYREEPGDVLAFAGQLQQLHARAKEMILDHQGREVALQMIADFVRKIPIDSHYFNRLSPQQRKSCLKTLSELFLFYQENSTAHELVTSPKEIVTAYTLYLCSYQLAQLIDPLAFEDYVPSLEIWKDFERSEAFELLDLSLKERLEELYQIVQRDRATLNHNTHKAALDFTECTIQTPSNDDSCNELKFYKKFLDRNKPLAERLSDLLKHEYSDATEQARAEAALAGGKLHTIEADHWLYHFQTCSQLLRGFHDITPLDFRAEVDEDEEATEARERPLQYPKQITNNLNDSTKIAVNPKTTYTSNRLCKGLWPESEGIYGTPIYEVKRNQALHRQLEEASEFDSLSAARSAHIVTDSHSSIYRQVALSGVERSLQPLNLLSLVTSHSFLFNKREMQSLFWQQLFKSAYAEDQEYAVLDLKRLLTENPLLLEYLSSFVREGLRSCIDLQPQERPQVETALFFIRVATEIGYHLPDEHNEGHWELIETCKRQIQKLAECPTLEESAYGLIHLHKLHLELMLHECEREEHSIDEIAISWIATQSIQQLPEQRQIFLERLVHSRLYPLLLKWELDETYDWSAAATAAFTKLGLTVGSDSVWTKERGTLSLRCGDLNIQLFNGHIFEKGTLLSRCRPDIDFRNSHYQVLFGEERFFFFKQGETTYIFDHPKQGRMRLLIGEYSSITVHHMIDGKWYEHVTVEGINRSERALPGTLIQNRHHWLSLEDEDKKLMISTKERWNEPIATLSEQEPIALRADMYVTEGQRGSLFSVLETTKFHEECYDRRSGELRHINLPNCRNRAGKELRFHKSGASFSWGSDQRYLIDRNVDRDLLCTIQYLTMTHKESGKRKLLVPAAPLDARCTSAFDGKGNLQIEEMMRNWNGPPNLRTILEYNLDPQGNLHAQSVEGTLFLAYLRLHERKYEEAFQLLTEVSEIDNHSKLLEEICNWILGYGEGHKQRNAIVHAFRLKVATLQSRMTNSPPQIISVYEDYLNQLSAVPSHFRLTRNEERALLAGMDGALAGRNAEIEKEALEPSISESKGYLVTPTLEKIDAWNKLGIYLWSVRCIEELQTDELKFTEVEQNSSEFFFRAWKVIIENQQEKKAELISALQKELAMRHFRKTSNHLFPNTEAINFLLFFALQESLEGAPEAAYPAGNEDSTLQQEVSGWFQEWLQYGKTLRCEKVVILRNRMQAAIEAPAEERGRHVEERKIAAAQVADQNAPTFATLAGKLEAATPLEIEVEALPVTPTNVKSPDEYSASIARELTAVQKDYDAGADLLRKRKTYAISAPDLTDLKRRTTTLRDTLKRSCSKLEKDILTLANKLPENREQRLHRELDLAQNRIRKLTIWDLEKLYMLRKGSAFTEANSALTPEDSEHLSQLMANWEVEQINLSRTHEALKKVGEIENCPQTDNGRELRKVLCAKLHAILSIDLSSFDEEERTNYLIFNRVTGKHPRSDQRANINKLAPLGEPCVLNMIMGAGKTAVIAPLWAKRTADSGKLPVLLVDGSQYDTVAHALKKSQKSCFGQEVCTISFLRQDLTQERLAQIDMKLAEIHESGSLLVMKPQMVQLLDLERFLALQTLSLQADEEMKEALQIRIQTLNSILKKFKQAAALGDEIDLLLRSDKEVTLPVGAVQHIAPEKVALGRTLLEHLVSNRIMIEGQTLRDYVGLAEKRQTQLTEEDWKKIIPLLAKELFQSQLLRLKKLPELEADFIKFVSGEPVDETSAFWLKVNQMHEAEDPADQMAAELISMAKHLCKQIIPAAFRQTGGRNFGRWRNLGQPEAKPGMAIPYLAADTPALTEFAYHYEALIKHFMLAAQVGVEECQVEYVAQMFEAMAYQQMQDSDEQFHETAEAISFFDMTGVQLLNIRNEGALKRATDQINSSRENRIAFETETANLYAAYHAARLTSTQQSLTNLFGQVSGMTGTPWNSGGYKPEMADNLHLDEGTQGAIIRSIIDRSEKTEVLPLDASNIEEELAKFYDETSGKFADGIFDSAAIFSKGGLTNRQVAEAILKFLNSKEHDGESLRQRAVLFFDKPEGGQQANQFTALIRIEGSDEYKVVALDSTDRGEIEKAGLNSPEEYVIFLPERQTTGTDIPMSLLANAYVTFDETMTLRTLLQTIMRERDFLNQQRTHFVFSPSLLAKMEATCGNTPSELIKQLLMMAIANEAREKADSQLRAYKQMFDEVFLQKMRDHLESENWDNLEEALRVYRPFLFPENSDQLFNQFFGNEEDVDTLEYLGILVESMIGKFENAVRLSGRPFLRRDLDDIKEKLDVILRRAEANRESFPTKQSLIRDKVDAPELMFRGEQLQERLVEQDVEQQTELELDQLLEQDLNAMTKPDYLSERNESEWYKKRNALINIAEYSGSQDLGEAISKTPHDIGDRYQRFAPLFRGLNVTANYHQSSRIVLPCFHPYYRTPDQVLIVEQLGRYSAYFLSKKEAAAIAQQLKGAYKRGEQQNIWLLSPDMKQFAPNPIELPIESNEQLRDLVIKINIFAGRITPLEKMRLLSDAESFLEQHPVIGADFLTMRCSFHAGEKQALVKSGLLGSASTASHTFVSVARAEKELLANIDPEQVKELDGAHVRRINNIRLLPHLTPAQIPFIKRKFVRELKKREQIQAIAPDFVNECLPSQVEHLTKVQLRNLSKKELIEQIPARRLEEFTETPPKAFISNLSAAQIRYLPPGSEAWVEHIKPELLCFLPCDLVDAVHPTLCHLLDPDTQFLQLTPAQALGIKDPELIKKISERVINSIEEQPEDEWIAALDMMQVRKMDKPAWLAHVNPDHIQYIKKGRIPAIPKERINYLEPHLIQYITSTQAFHLNRDDLIERLNREQIQGVEGIPEWVGQLSGDQVQFINNIEWVEHVCPEHLHQLSIPMKLVLYRAHPTDEVLKSQIASCEDEALVELFEDEELEGLLHPNLVCKLTAKRCQSLESKLNYISRDQYLELVREGVALPDRLHRTIELRDLAGVPAATIIKLQELRAVDISSCTDPDLLLYLSTEEQETAPDALFINARTRDQLSNIPDSKVHLVTDLDAIKNLNTFKWKLLTVETLNSLPDEHVSQIAAQAIPDIVEKAPSIETKLSPCKILGYYRYTRNKSRKDALKEKLQASTDESLINSMQNGKEMVELLHPDLIAKLTGEELIKYRQANGTKITPEQCIELIDRNHRALLPRDIQTTPEAVQALTPQQMSKLVAFAPNLLKHYRNPAVVALIPQFECGNLHADLIKEITEQDSLRKLSDEQLPHINANYMHLLDENKRGNITVEQIKEITEQAALQAIPNNMVQHANPNLIHLLTEAQRAHLDNGQVGAITEQAAIQAVPNNRVEYVHPDRVGMLQPAQKEQVTQDQVQKISDVDAFKTLPLEKRKWGNRKVMQDHMPYQRQASVTISLVAISALTLVAAALAACLILLPTVKMMPWMRTAKQFVGKTKLIAVAAGGGALFILQVAIEVRRRSLQRQKDRAIAPNLVE